MIIPLDNKLSFFLIFNQTTATIKIVSNNKFFMQNDFFGFYTHSLLLLIRVCY